MARHVLRHRQARTLRHHCLGATAFFDTSTWHRRTWRPPFPHYTATCPLRHVCRCGCHHGSPPRALRIGPALDKHLVRRKPQLIKRVEEDIEAATSRPGSATHARRERSRKHAERAARAEWLASKAEQSKARSETGPATMTPEDAEAEVIADRNRREGAYVSWLDRKREEHEKKILARMHAAGKALNVKGFEIRDLRRVYGERLSACATRRRGLLLHCRVLGRRVLHKPQWAGWRVVDHCARTVCPTGRAGLRLAFP